jgi:hypothetical protein
MWRNAGHRGNIYAEGDDGIDESDAIPEEVEV